MREAGDQAKTACGNLQMCAGLEASIEVATNSVGQGRLERLRERRHEEEETEVTEGDEEEEGEEIGASQNNLIIETGGTEEEAT